MLLVKLLGPCTMIHHNNPSPPAFAPPYKKLKNRNNKTEERLEQALGKLKGEFLLARAECEEKLNQSNEKTELYKEKYEKLKEMHHNLESAKRHTPISGSASSSGNSSGEDFHAISKHATAG